jgi:2-methylisocitrate lyase-like PEP mutase family enzyme
VEDEVNPKHSTFAGGLCSIGDMQARIEATQKGAGDSGLVVIARCDELYPSAYRGGGSGSLEQAIARGKAYIEAGADALVFPLATPEATAELGKALSKPIVVLGLPIPGTACTLHTGWGWLGAAKLHLERATELMATGKVTADLNLEGKNALIEQDLFDGLISDWAKKTGRETR